MSTFTSEPGTRLGGRYRLEDRLAAASGWSAWKAIDEILARPVSVITFAAGFPRLQQVVTAARAASRLTDTRLTQVFDVEDDWDRAYIVLEWPFGETLTDLLAAARLTRLRAHGSSRRSPQRWQAHTRPGSRTCASGRILCAGRRAAESRSPGSASTRHCPASQPTIPRWQIPKGWVSCSMRLSPACGRARIIRACRRRHCPMASQGGPGRYAQACRRRSTRSPAGHWPCQDAMARPRSRPRPSSRPPWPQSFRPCRCRPRPLLAGIPGAKPTGWHSNASRPGASRPGASRDRSSKTGPRQVPTGRTMAAAVSRAGLGPGIRTAELAGAVTSANSLR